MTRPQLVTLRKGPLEQLLGRRCRLRKEEGIGLVLMVKARSALQGLVILLGWHSLSEGLSLLRQDNRLCLELVGVAALRTGHFLPLLGGV